jgi:hypothetical protein
LVEAGRGQWRMTAAVRVRLLRGKAHRRGGRREDGGRGGNGLHHPR